MKSASSTPNLIKKRQNAPQPPRSRSGSILTLTKSSSYAYRLQQRAATHNEVMQRFQLRKVSADKVVSPAFGRGKQLIIDKTTGRKHSKGLRVSLNRMVRSIFGSKARKHLFSWCTSPITPKSWTSTAHGGIMLAVYHFQLVYLPFLWGYGLDTSQRSATTFIVLETIFLVDLLLNFNTAYFDQGGLVKSRAKIAFNYLRTWFAFDLLSALPLQAGYCLRSSSCNLANTALKDIQISLMILRLLRVMFLEKGVLLSRVMRVANHVAEWLRYSRYSHLLGIAQLMWLVLLIAHYMACLWHVVSKDHTSQEQRVGEQYVADYYYAVSLIQGQGNTVGTWGENLYSSVAIIVGSVILAIVFGNVAMLVSNFNANETNYHRKMEAVYATMDKMDLPLDLRKRVNEYYTHVWQEYEVLDGNINEFEKELTHTLRIEIGLYKFMNLVVKVPFWEDCTPDFLTQVVLGLSMRVYMPDDYVVRRHEIGSEMMMINLGYCKLSKPVKHLTNVNEGTPSAGLKSPNTGTTKPVLTQNDVGADDQSDKTSDDDWGTTSSDDETNDEFETQLFSPQMPMRRMSGSVFELPGGDADPVATEGKPDQVHPRRHSNPSSIPSSAELERPKRLCMYLNPGQVFGEMSLLMNYERQASIRAVTFVEMCVLDRNTFQKIISRYPQDRRRVLTKMLESCIEKKEIPFPWENIIEAVSVKRRTNFNKDISRASVIATMTASEAARILVEAIDINVPDDSIKYGFQSFDQTFVEDPSLRRANSVGAKIRDTLQRSSSGMKETVYRSNGMLVDSTLQRSNSGIPSTRACSRRNVKAGSGRSSTTTDLSTTESDLPEEQSRGLGCTEKSLEGMMQLMYTMVEKIGCLQKDLTELKKRDYRCNKCCYSGESSAGGSRKKSPLVSVTVVAPPTSDTGAAWVAPSVSSDLHSVEHLTRTADASDVSPPDRNVSQEHRATSSLVSTRRSSSSDASYATGSSRSAHDDAAGLIKTSRVEESRRSFKPSNTERKLSPPSEIPTAVEPNVDRYMERHLGRVSGRTRVRHQPTLADFLWKRSNTSVDLNHSTHRSEARRSLKVRRSLPAGASVVAVAYDLNEIPPVIDEHEATVENGDNDAQKRSVAWLTSLGENGGPKGHPDFDPSN